MSGIMSMLLGAVSSAAAAVDEFFNRVTLLLPGNGTNGAQNNTFLDSSTNNFSITRNGNTTQGTFSPFSQTGWSNHFNGATTSGPFISASYSTTNFDWFTSGQDFTLECWVFPADLATFSYSDGTNIIPRLTGNADVGGTINYWSFGPISDGKVRLHYFNGATVQVTSTSTVTANTWNHIAFTKTSSGIIIFVNGTATTATAVSGTPQSSASYPLVIGRINNASINGYVSNYRILKNVTPPYSGSYTVPTLPLTDISGTKILTAQANRFVDSSSVANALTVSGSTISVQAFEPFAPGVEYSAATVGGSGYFDGTGDYLTAAGNAAFAFGTGDFTVAAWIYPTNAQRITILSSNYTYISGSGNWSLYFDVGSAQTLYFNSQSGNKASTVTTTIPLNAWSHIAYTRVGTTGRFFVNGVQLGADISDSFNYGGGTGNLFVGQQNDGNALMLGYMSGIQVLKGTGYSSLPIPTAPATNITNTSLLLNFTNAGITDATAKNDLETVGNAQISTTQSKFGGSSMYFDGTGDYALTISSVANSALGSGDWTVEFWLYTNVGSTTYNVIDWRPNATQGAYFSFYLNSGTPTYYTSSADRIVGGSAIPATTWTHVAVSRSGTSTKMFINGTQSGSTYTDTANYLGAVNRPAIGGGGIDTNNTLNGYIDDLRVTRGYARYTANFTAPTTAFPLQ